MNFFSGYDGPLQFTMSPGNPDSVLTSNTTLTTTNYQNGVNGNNLNDTQTTQLHETESNMETLYLNSNQQNNDMEDEESTPISPLNHEPGFNVAFVEPTSDNANSLNANSSTVSTSK